jgi:large conductance mechanosensitive channel
MVIFEEFRKFAVRGNVADMAVGVIIGAAFGPIVKSVVDDLIMPPVGLLVGNVDFKDLFVVLRAPPMCRKVGDVFMDSAGTSFSGLDAVRAHGGVVLGLGTFANTILNFLIVAFAVFLLVKGMNKLASKEPPPPPNTKDCPLCATAIPLAAKRCPHCTSDLAKA